MKELIGKYSMQNVLAAWDLELKVMSKRSLINAVYIISICSRASYAQGCCRIGVLAFDFHCSGTCFACACQEIWKCHPLVT